ncbi:putative MFS transporter, AGZA family, xanthine/uracil permease [Clostridium amylolyticum]|uniref:Putative MFS transporter, AGZA family, xanthine/uracil permease n=1 Tax=Clostridium amylolyticum TaxID=1121298 RepID=A0A1M6H5L0_9CLOT|nr:permease [Clostridium amylolyticum]SHJ17480.1 putative MFS transporter, AGZA family, xanthine/uracil permease [Clostridium amylolyticum]
MDNVKIPLFKKADLDASIGVFFDGFSKVIVAIAILVGTFGLDKSIVFGTIMPGLLVGVVLLNGGLWLYYRNIAKQRKDPDLTAIPAGLQAGRMFIWLFSIMLPVFASTGDAVLAFKVGVFANFVGSVVFIIGAFVVPKLLKIVPSGALFGSLAGGAMAFLILQSMDGVLKMPVVGWLSLTVLFVIYLGKINTKLPAALIAIVIGSAIAWITGAMGIGAVKDSLSNVSVYLPKLTLYAFSSDVISTTITYLPIIIVFSISEVITGIQGVEQARECGDDFFTTTQPLVIAGTANLISAFVGNPLSLGLYWGYPGWKKMKSGTGYHLGIVILYSLVCLTGLTAIINAFIPEATVLPILIFVGISSYSQAFDVVTKKYYPAVILASLPVVMDFVVSKMAKDALPGFTVFQPGSAFIGLIVGCIFVYVIDNNWRNAAITNIVALGLALIGMIHSPGILFTDGYVFQTNFVIVYAVSAAAFFVMHILKFNQKAHADELALEEKLMAKER